MKKRFNKRYWQGWRAGRDALRVANAVRVNLLILILLVFAVAGSDQSADAIRAVAQDCWPLKSWTPVKLLLPMAILSLAFWFTSRNLLFDFQPRVRRYPFTQWLRKWVPGFLAAMPCVVLGIGIGFALHGLHPASSASFDTVLVSTEVAEGTSVAEALTRNDAPAETAALISTPDDIRLLQRNLWIAMGFTVLFCIATLAVFYVRKFYFGEAANRPINRAHFYGAKRQCSKTLHRHAVGRYVMQKTGKSLPRLVGTLSVIWSLWTGKRRIRQNEFRSGYFCSWGRLRASFPGSPRRRRPNTRARLA